jgi:transcriptional regulator with XRE-family HTH domain
MICLKIFILPLFYGVGDINMKSSLKYIGENIRNARLAKNLTIEQLAELADITDSFLGVVERGSSGISVETLISIAIALNVTADSLIMEKSIPSEVTASKKDTLLALLQTNNESELDFLIDFINLYRKKAKFEEK